MPKHIHAELMAQYAQDAMETDKPWELWECDSGKGWIEGLGPFLFDPCYKYRRKPKTFMCNGWILWNGGECPVDDLDAKVEVWVRCGSEPQSFIREASHWQWRRLGLNSDIIAYRIVEEEKEVEEPLSEKEGVKSDKAEGVNQAEKDMLVNGSPIVKPELVNTNMQEKAKAQQQDKINSMIQAIWDRKMEEGKEFLRQEHGDTLSTLSTQAGGTHYKDMAIQPIEFIVANKLEYRVGNVIKYACRHENKNGAEDIRKAIHYLEMILETDYACGGLDPKKPS